MSDQNPKYDLFISYHWRDHERVEQVDRALTDRQLKVFLDRRDLRPGQNWVTELEAALANCRAVAVMLGPDGMGSWQLREQAFALDRQAQVATFPVIPVLLPGAEPPLGFLKLNTWIDLRAGIQDALLESLVAAVRGEPLDDNAQAGSQAARADVCPFRGLLPFYEADAEFFCGREAYTDELLDRVTHNPLVAVVGASGSGKSSVARAGLLPALRRPNAAGGPWEIATLVPTGEPFRSLAAALLPLLDPGLQDEIERLTQVRKLADKLGTGEIPLRDLIRDIVERQPGTQRLCLLVDQWEELYTVCRDDDQRERFIDELLDASEQSPLSVVLTLRGDFVGETLRHRRLADRMQPGTLFLGPMKREELTRAIEEPAEKLGLRFRGNLVARMLDDVGEEPGNLPLLEFVLSQLWEQRQGTLLLADAYDAMRGVRGAIASRAERLYAQFDASQQELARTILLQLVRTGESIADTRQRVHIDATDSGRLEVLQRLADARLIVTGQDEAAGEQVAEVSHEALIGSWERLRGWLKADRDFLNTRNRLQFAAEQWLRAARPADRLLQPGGPLKEGRALLRTRRGDLNADIIDYIDASVQRQRRRVAARSVLVLIALLPIVAGAFLLWTNHHGLTPKAGLSIWSYRIGFAELEAVPEMIEIRPDKPIPGAKGRFSASYRRGSTVFLTEEPVQVVTFTKPFAIGKYEVTFAEYEVFVVATGRRDPNDKNWGRESRPVIDVSWDDAQAYIQWLSLLTGQRYRLPTDDEWEYVARGGTETPFWWGDDVRQDGTIWANCNGCGSQWDGMQTAPVGSFPANAFGLHDTAGNVSERVEDCWHRSYNNAPNDGSARLEGDGGDCSRRVIRGGSWDDKSWNVRSANRYWVTPGNRTNLVGFRLAQDIQ